MSPLVYFARLVFGQWYGKLGAVVSMGYGVVAGAILPMLVAKLIRGFGTPHLFAAVRALIICFFLAMILEIAQRFLLNVVSIRARSLNADMCAKKSVQVPLDASEEGYQTKLHRFFFSSSRAVYVFVSEFLALSVGLLGFVGVLVATRVPWQIYVVVVLFLAVPIVSVRILKQWDRFGETIEKEGEEIEALELLYVSRKDTWILPALQAHRQVISGKVREAGRRSERIALIRLSIKAVLKALIGITAIGTVLFVPPEVAALLVVFSLTFAGHLGGLYYIVEFFYKLNHEASPLLEVLNLPKKPPLPLPVGGSLIQYHDLKVRYPEKVVALGSGVIEPHTLACLRQRNGAGKTTLGKVLTGQISYEGSLWHRGREVNQYRPQGIRMLDQTRHPKPVVLKRFFERREWTCWEEELLGFVLKNVDAAKIDLTTRHDRLSEGERQKIDIALLMFHTLLDTEVELVIFDEPLNHIASVSKEIVWQGIDWFCTLFWGSVVIISHDPLPPEIKKKAQEISFSKVDL